MARPATSPWRRLAIGETVLVQGRTRASLKGCVSHLKPMRFSFRQVMVNGEVSTRVWRIA